jgi:hypothetical protein
MAQEPPAESELSQVSNLHESSVQKYVLPLDRAVSPPPIPKTCDDSTPSQTINSGCHLLHLPQELRDVICRYLPIQYYCDIEIHQVEQFKLTEPVYSAATAHHPLRHTCRDFFYKWNVTFPSNKSGCPPPEGLAPSIIVMTWRCNKSELPLSVFDRLMELCLSMDDHIRRKVVLKLLPDKNNDRDMRMALNFLHEIDGRVHVRSDIQVIVRFPDIQGTEEKNWLSHTVAIRHLLRFGIHHRNQVYGPPSINCFLTEAESLAFPQNPLWSPVRFSILNSMPREWLKATCAQRNKDYTELLPHAEHLWRTGDCSCCKCRMAEACELWTLL